LRFDNPIYDHKFVFPDIGEFPDIKHEPKFIDTQESNTDIQKMNVAFNNKNNIEDFIKIYSKYNVNDSRVKEKLNGFFKFYQTFEKTRKELDLPDSDIHQSLFEDGIYFTSIDTNLIKQKLQSKINELLDRPDWTPPPGVFDRAIDVSNEVKDIVQQEFKSAGILNATSKYNKGNRLLNVARVVLHIAKPTDSNWKQFLYDCKTVTQTTHMHIDPKEDVIKSMIYLNDVDKTSGAFSYVPQSNRYIYDSMQNIFGRAISTGSYCHNEQSRKSIFGLPAHLRVSFNFGRTLLDSNPLQKTILDKEIYFESNNGNCCIFDPAGMHRGGQCTNGNRIALQVLLK